MTKKEVFFAAKEILQPFCGEYAAQEARFLLEFLCGCDHTDLLLHGEEPVAEEQGNRLLSAAHKRARGYPLQYLTGRTLFLGIPLFVGEGVLIPRSDTEFAVMRAVELMRGRPHPVVADLCSGTGCIALAMEQEVPDADYYAVEWEPKACFYLEKNIGSLRSGVRAIRADVTVRKSAAFLPECDLIVSNPPYIREGERGLMGKDVLACEPESALFAGENGMYFYRKIIENFLPVLKPEGYFVFEIGFSQGKEIQELLADSGMDEIRIEQDFSGNDRVASARKRGNR